MAWAGLLMVLTTLGIRGVSTAAYDMPSLDKLAIRELHWGNFGAAYRIEQRGARRSIWTQAGFDLLARAVTAGDVESMRSLLKNGCSPNAKYYYDWTPLHIAAQEGQLDALRVLASAGAKLDSLTKGGKTALLCSLTAGEPEIARKLLILGSDATIADGTGYTPLMAAVQHCKDLVPTIMARKVDVNRRNRDGQNALILAASALDTVSTRLLLANGSDARMSETGSMRQTALIAAAAHEGAPAGRATEIAEALLRAGAPINAADSAGMAALMYAAKNGDKDLVVLLLSKGAAARLRDHKGRTAEGLCGMRSDLKALIHGSGREP